MLESVLAMKEYNRMVLASNIKNMRQQKHKNQSELANDLHVSQQTVAAWETGRAIPGSDTLTMIADYFCTTPDKMLGVKQESYSSDLDAMLDHAESYNGKPMTQHDREIIRAYLEGHFGK